MGFSGFELRYSSYIPTKNLEVWAEVDSDWLLSLVLVPLPPCLLPSLLWILSWSCHLDRLSNDEFSVEFWMFALIFFSAYIKIRSERLDLKEVQITFIRMPYLKRDNFNILALDEINNKNKYSTFKPILTFNVQRT